MNLERLYRLIDKVRRALIILLFGFVIVTCFLDVIFRYVPPHRTMGWTEEVARYLNVWIIFLGASIAAQQRLHLNVEIFVHRLLPRYHRHVAAGVTGCCLVFLLVFVVSGSVKAVANFQQEMLSLPLSIAWFYFAIPVGSVLMMLELTLLLVYGDHPFYARKEE